MAGALTRDRLEAFGAKAVAELADTDGVRECLQWFRREKHWINARHLDLCRIPAPTFQEQARAEWIADQFRETGWETRLDRAGNVIASMDGGWEGPFVALTAHLDTVLAPRGPDDITVKGDGMFQGPGVSDNGSGLVALLAIARAIRSCPPISDCRRPLLLVANVGEEGEGNLSGMRFLCRQSPLGSRIKAFVVLDGPSTDQITCRALASRRFEITLAGPGGHSWSDYGVANPVHALSRAITLFSDNGHNGVGPAGDESGLRSSFNFGTIDGGTSINSIPTTARAKVDMRSESPVRVEEMAVLLTSCLEQALKVENDRSSGSRLTGKIREIGSRPAGCLPDDAPILRFLRAVDAHLGIRSHLDCASTDANIPLSMGLHAVSIGAGGRGGGAHTPEEWYHPEGREIGLQRILLALCLLMRQPAAAARTE